MSLLSAPASLSRSDHLTILRRLGANLAILLVIAYLTSFGLIVAERGRKSLPAQPLNAASEALRRTADYVIDHPTTYLWRRESVSAFDLVATAFIRSTGLLLAALGIATIVGVPLGITVAVVRRVPGAPLVLLLSVLGVSTPSFLLAMVLWVLDIQIARHMGMDTAPLPPTGFGWDAHLVMPALVLAARPLAQVMQITYVAVSEVLEQDYIRTAYSKGLALRVVLARHALRNALVPILTTLGTSLRFSLASLPVVEYFFIWPGVGLTLLQAIEQGLPSLVTDLIVALGLLFLLINLALDFIYPILDPHLRKTNGGEQQEDQTTWREKLGSLTGAIAEWWSGLRDRLPGMRHAHSELAPLPVPPGLAAASADLPGSRSPRRAWRIVLGNMPLIVGTLMVLAFFSLALFGEQLTAASPNLTHGIMMIEGKIAAPPFRPSSVFPWGSDPVGRDVQALVLAGAKQTLALALFGTAARVFLGVTLGIIAGWWHGSWLDKLLNGTVAVWAAFPVTVFAMLLILALGIQQGMSVFVVALCVVGWGEIAQFVRGQVISLKPKPYIEAARSVGAGANRILTRHVLPHLVPSLLVLAILEMGGVLMLLAELGFLNIFLGGGFRAEIADTGRAGINFYFSDIPEWGALLSNIRAWWRSYPWLAWYPGIFFFGAILAFNLWGEGLRRLLQESRLNVSRVLNRYTLVAVGGAVLGLIWTLWNTAPLGVYRSQALQFNAQRAMEDVRVLASPDMQGRETGTPGAKRAADTIAQQMEAIGLFPGGEKNTFIQAFPCPRFHLTDVPRLEILDPQGKVAQSLAYRQDMVEYIGSFQSYGEGEGELVGVAAGPDPGTPQGQDAYGLGNLDLRDKIILIREAMATRINPGAAAGVLVVAEAPSIFQHKYLFAQQVIARPKSSPVMFISQEAAERLLVATGSNLAQLNSQAASLQPGQVALTASGARVRMSVIGMDSESPDELCYNVIGYIPGIAAAQQLDSHVIMASAYYDGLGTGPDGTLYPGANDNASGVAVMLEIARNLKRSPYQPKKTVVFVAWTRAERYESLSVSDVMSAKIGFNTLTIEAVIELSGAGAGDGKGIALGQGSSFRMVQLFQAAAERMGVATTTRGRGPHFGLPSRVGFGGRSALSAYVSWDGSDRTAHTAQDTVETIRPEKMKQVGQTTLLALMVLARETNY